MGKSTLVQRLLKRDRIRGPAAARGRLRAHEVLHDWPDEECVAILAAIRRAARDHSTLLNVEGVLPEDHNDPRAGDLA